MKKYLSKKIRFLLEYFALIFFIYFFRIFPLKLCLRIAEILGTLFFYIDKKHKSYAIKNLSNAFPEKKEEEILDICRKMYKNLAKTFIEFIYLPKLNKRYFKSKIKIVGEKNLKEALKLNRGIVAVTGHLDNWELLGAVVVKYGYPLVAFYHPMRNPYSDALFNKIRKTAGIELISIKDSVINGIKALKSNKLLGLIADQDAGSDGIFVKFFGQEASTYKGPAIFASKFNSPMILFIMVREKNDNHTLYISKPFKIRHDIYYDTLLWSNELEKWIRKYPEQWFWVHRRWHTKKS